MSKNVGIIRERKTDFLEMFKNLFGTPSNEPINDESEKLIENSKEISEEDKKLLEKTLKSIERREVKSFEQIVKNNAKINEEGKKVKINNKDRIKDVKKIEVNSDRERE